MQRQRRLGGLDSSTLGGSFHKEDIRVKDISSYSFFTLIPSSQGLHWFLAILEINEKKVITTWKCVIYGTGVYVTIISTFSQWYPVSNLNSKVFLNHTQTAWACGGWNWGCFLIGNPPVFWVKRSRDIILNILGDGGYTIMGVTHSHYDELLLLGYTGMAQSRDNHASVGWLHAAYIIFVIIVYSVLSQFWNL